MVLSTGPSKGSGYEIIFQKNVSPELQSELDMVRRRIFASLNTLPIDEPLIVSRNQWTEIKNELVEPAENVVWRKNDADVVTIGVRNLVVQQLNKPSGDKPVQAGFDFKTPKVVEPEKSTLEKKVRMPEATYLEKKEAVVIAKTLRLPEEGRMYRKFKIGFNWNTSKYEYRNEAIHCKKETGEMLTQKEVRDWMKKVTSSKRRGGKKLH